jgi:hypothetical protein
MTIWLLALVLLASLAGLGYRQGAVRVAFSCLGIVVGALLAATPLTKLLKPALLAAGLKNPVLIAILAPTIFFFLVSILFKVGAVAVHQKVDVYFRYQAGDLRLTLWERLNSRLGLCLGLVNATLYFILITALFNPLSYWTFQTATSDSDPKMLKILNRLGQDMQSTGFNTVARVLDPLPVSYYDAADLAGILYNNSLLEARLSRYPAFLSLAERPEFLDLGNDKEFVEMWQRHDPVMNMVNHPKIQNIIDNPELLGLIWGTLVPDLADLRTFLETGHSPKYGPERILGRWKFDVTVAFAMMRRAKPNISSTEMQRMRKWMVPAFANTSFVAMIDHQAILRNLPQLKLPAAGAAAGAAVGPQTLQGQWKNVEGKYQITLGGAQREEQLDATVEVDRLSFKSQGMDLVFTRED